MSEYEHIRVSDSSYSAHVVNGAYSGNKNQRGTSNHSDSAAITRDMLNGKTADVRQNAKEASNSVSKIQKLTKATGKITKKLLTMKEIADKAGDSDRSQVEIEEMQKELKNHAKEINEIVKDTKIENNKIFTSAGESISIPVGDGSKTNIFAKNLSFNADELDISTDTKTASYNIIKAMNEINEYKEYLNKQRTRIEDATKTIESELESAMGIELEDFTLDKATEMSSDISNKLAEDDEASLNTQDNITPTEALKLLESNK